jgi:LysM repeat protein
MIYEIIFSGVAFFHPYTEKDSIGTEMINGKIFVLHKVDEKETLYAISRRYGASVEVIQQSNPGLSSTLEVGQILKVPYEKKAVKSIPAGATTHKVAPKETMYSISKTYGVSVDELKKWNNLTDNSLSVGQEIIVKKPSPGQKVPVETKTPELYPVSIPVSGVHVVSAKETLYSIARLYGLSVSQLRSWNLLESDEVQAGQTIFVNAPETRKTPVVVQQEVKKETPVEVRNPEAKIDPPTPVPAKNQTIRISESMKNSDEIIESGVAELIDGTEGNRKYLALHRSAPVGTILKVRNEMNNREVFVRVMGKLPETAVNQKLIIKLSRSAYDRLGAIDPRFRVELTYYK